MSELSDKIAYIKGLCAGIDFSADTPEGKLLMAIVDALGSVKDELDAVRDDHEELAEYVDVLDNDLEELEGEVYGSGLRPPRTVRRPRPRSGALCRTPCRHAQTGAIPPDSRIPA